MLQTILFMENFFRALSQTNIFKGLNEQDISELLAEKPFRLKEYGRDEYIAFSKDMCNDMLIVVAGAVRGEMTDFSGRKLKIEDIPAPRPLAVAFIFGRENRFPVDIIANEPSTIMVIPRDVLIYMLQKNQVVLRNYLNAISSRTQFLSNKIRFLSFKSIREKIANYILSGLKPGNDKIVLDQSQTELADFFGVARPSLARAFAEMEEEGMLKVERREITILNKEKLNKLLGD
jgi:CRP/FNR family transcriptional regulator, dissimilatory nitrate respiration regulator